MSAPAIVLAGTACSGEPWHLSRLWTVSRERRVYWRTGALDADLPPIPGERAVVLLEPHQGPLATLADGTRYRYSKASYAGRWVGHEPLYPGGDPVSTTKPRIILAGATCVGAWYVFADRTLVVSRDHGPLTAPTSHPIPGTAAPVVVDLSEGVRIVLADGSSHGWTGGGWARLPTVGTTTGAAGDKVKVRILTGFCLGEGVDVNPGDVLELDGELAMKKLRQGGYLELVDEGAA